MPSIETSKVVGHSIKVINGIDSFCLAVHFDEIFNIKSFFNGEIYRFIDFFLLTNLSICKVKKARFSRIGCGFFGLKSFDLNDEDFRHFVEF
jgi:hypothetical protein